jgi:hypothetical protein
MAGNVGLEGSMDKGQQRLMRLHEGGGETEEACAVRAWGLVAEGYGAALGITGLSADDRAFLLQQLRCADELAQRAPLVLAPSLP